MIARVASVATLTLLGLVCAVPAEANWLGDFSDCVVQDVVKNTKRRNCWPKPFTCPDRFSVRAPFAMMVSNGWERQNTLGDHQFDPQTGELNEAGRLKVHWILTQAPAHHRTIFLYGNPADPETAAKRMDSIHRVAAVLAPSGGVTPVLQTDKPAPGLPARHVDIIFRAWDRSEYPPRIPYLDVNFRTASE